MARSGDLGVCLAKDVVGGNASAGSVRSTRLQCGGVRSGAEQSELVKVLGEAGLREKRGSTLGWWGNR